ncbi:MAG: divalent metal cation transporter [Planctomycetota bacterium]
MSDTPESSASLGDSKVQSDRKLLEEARANGKLLTAFVRLSGPGWLQAAITLGGGSLGGALFLGVLGGTSLLWLQLVAIIMGVIMLSAISYVTLSTGRRPFEAINSEINPALGWGWLIATALANIIWCMPQFSLCYDALDKNLAPLFREGGLGNDVQTKYWVTRCLFIAAGIVVLLNTKQGRAAKLFDLVLKAMVGLIVLCFFGVVILLLSKGSLDFQTVFSGFIPKLNQLNQPTGQMAEVVASLGEYQQYWTDKLVGQQRQVMIAAAATAVGINMTFLLPYSMLARGWDKPFRGLSRFDLCTGMAIPYVLVTSCVVIAAAASLHNTIDDSLASNELSVMQESEYWGGVEGILLDRIDHQLGDAAETTSKEEKLEMVAALDVKEKTVALSLVKRNAFQLSKTLEPLLGEEMSNLVFGIGVLGMGFSTIIILMLINGYVFQEMTGSPNGKVAFIIGCLVAGIAGEGWIFLWSGDARVWLVIIASTFGSMLLPIAYVTFFLMMNSKRILGDEKPKGFSMVVWNMLMAFAVAGSIAAAYYAIEGKAKDADPEIFYFIVGLAVSYGIIVVAGFFLKSKPKTAE